MRAPAELYYDTCFQKYLSRQIKFTMLTERGAQIAVSAPIDFFSQLVHYIIGLIYFFAKIKQKVVMV